MDFNRSHSQNLEMGEDGENVPESDEHLQQLAHQGAATGNLSLLMDAVNHDPSVLECQDDKGMTPLSHAVINKQLDMVKLLVRMGAGINTQDAMGRTPLCLAAYEGWYHGVVYLLRSGAKQSIPDRNGRLPLHAATHDSDSKTLSALLQTLTIGDINETDNDGMTALHWAAFHNRPEHVQLLMLRGADIYSADVDEKTPLHWASQNGCLACCSIMAKCRSGGAPLVNAMEGSGKSCTHLSAAAGYSEILEEFTDIPGVDFEALDPDDRTPLHWAAVSGQEDCVKFLLDLGVMHSPRDINNCTPLDYAKQANKPDCIKELHKSGAEYGVTQSPAKHTNDDTKDGTSSRKNSGQGTRKKRFGFLSDIFSRTKNGLRSKQSSVESNEDNATVVETSESMEMTGQESNSKKLQEKLPKSVCDSENNKTLAKSSDEEDVEAAHLDCSSSSPMKLSKKMLEEKKTMHKASSCHSNLAGAAVCDSNGSYIGQRSLSDESKECPDDDIGSGVRNRSYSIPTSVPSSSACAYDRNSSPVPERIPSFSHHSLLPSPGMPPKTASAGASSSNNTCLSAGYGDNWMAEPIGGLRPLCRELPDADTVQRHAQEILDAQRGLMAGKDEGDTGTAARSLSHMSLVTNPKLAPLSPQVRGRSSRWPSGGSQSDNVSIGFQSGHSTESLTFEIGAEVTGQSSGPESISLRNNRFDVLDPIGLQQKDKRKKRKKRAKNLERKSVFEGSVDLPVEIGTGTTNQMIAEMETKSEQPIAGIGSSTDNYR